MTELESRYDQRLRTFPAPGGGCHREILAVANLGVMIGLADHEIFQDIRRSIPTPAGARIVPDSEITNSIARARREVVPVANRDGGWEPRPMPPRATSTQFGARERDLFIKRGAGCGEADFHDFSPIELLPPIHCPAPDYSQDLTLILRHLYRADEYVFIGDQYGGRECVQPAAYWLQQIEQGNLDWKNSPHIIPNPLSGDFGLTHGGKQSYRADNCVSDRRLIVVEFDDLPIAEQFEFWAGMPLPLVALIDSGGKSLHAWVRVNCRSADEWNEVIKAQLYKQVLEPLGVDPTCKNPARLSRTPGRYRPGQNRWQKLLYLAPMGEALWTKI